MDSPITKRGGRGRKSLDADLNLVPYIDLLTCMIAFLLIAAVWTQLARLKVQQKGQGDVTSSTEPPATKIAVVVHQAGFGLVVGQDQKPLPLKGSQHDYDGLTAELKALKTSYPDKTDVQLLSEDAIEFGLLVRTMDATLTAGFPDISLLDAGGAGL